LPPNRAARARASTPSIAVRKTHRLLEPCRPAQLRTISSALIVVDGEVFFDLPAALGEVGGGVGDGALHTTPIGDGPPAQVRDRSFGAAVTFA
jgi:hypothetical protein